MKQCIPYLLLFLLVMVTCGKLDNSAVGPSGTRPVAVTVLARVQVASTYKITISGSGMDIIGPQEYAGGQTIEIFVPEGAARKFYFERYNGTMQLTDTGTTVAVVGSGINIIQVTLKTIASNYYTVNYNGNGNTSGSVPGVQTKTAGEALTLTYNTGNLKRTGYSFAGWNTTPHDTGTLFKEGASYTFDKSVVFYAKWTRVSTFPVIYLGNNNSSGSIPEAQSKTAGDTLILASNAGNLKRTGYTFIGWNTTPDDTGTFYAEGERYTSDASLILYAKWTTLPTFTVTYDGNLKTSGSVPAPQTKIVGDTLKLAFNTGLLKRTGYAFAGWSNIPNDTGTLYAEGASYIPVSPVTLYAKWKPLSTFTVTYDGNGNTSGSVPAKQTKFAGDTLTLAFNTGLLKRAGYTFAGWNTTPNDTGKNYGEGARYTSDSTVILYAKWTTLPTFTVTYVGDNATSGSTPAPQTKIAGDTLVLAFNTGKLKKTGYAFAGWITSPNDTGTLYKEGASYSFDKSMVLYAKWIMLSTYPVVYLDNGSSSGTVPAAQTKIAGDTLILASNTGLLKRTGYTFMGWNTTPNDSGTFYAEGASYISDATVILYAKWTALPTFTVTYDGNDNTSGSIPAKQTKIAGDALMLASNAGLLKRTGFAFAGWNTTSNGSGTNYTEGAGYTADTSIVLYAKWTALPIFTVTYDGNNNTSGSAPAPQTKIAGVTLILASISLELVKTGYTFIGWSTSADGEGTEYAEGASYTIDENVKLYAKWGYVVTYDGNQNNEGSVPDRQFKKEGASLILAYNTGNLKRTGYTFSGWSTSADGAGTEYSEGENYTVDTNIKLYAKWIKLP